MKPVPRNPQNEPHDDEPRAWLSALVDGEAQGAEQACGRWRDDEDLRRDWHAYQLIGDVMRSEDLASPALRDAAFLAGVRARLAAEPVVLAPQAVAEQPRRRQAWMVPVAAAAGFVVVAGVLVVTRMNQPVPGDGQLAVREPQPAVADVQQVMQRDPVLDEYIRAHRAVGNSLAVAAPGGGVRRVDITVSTTPER